MENTENTIEVKAVKVTPKHDKELFPAVAHTVIVRPRFQEWKDVYVIKVIDELGKCLQSFEYADGKHAENEYQKMLKAGKY